MNGIETLTSMSSMKKKKKKGYIWICSPMENHTVTQKQIFQECAEIIQPGNTLLMP